MTSKYELIQWINSFEGYKISKPENLQNGIFFCMITNLIYPNSIQTSLIKQKTTYNDFYYNYKLLQNALMKNQISKYINIDKLCKGDQTTIFDLLVYIKNLYDSKNKQKSQQDEINELKNQLSLITEELNKMNQQYSILENTCQSLTKILHQEEQLLIQKCIPASEIVNKLRQIRNVFISPQKNYFQTPNEKENHCEMLKQSQINFFDQQPFLRSAKKSPLEDNSLRQLTQKSSSYLLEEIQESTRESVSSQSQPRISSLIQSRGSMIRMNEEKEV